MSLYSKKGLLVLITLTVLFCFILGYVFSTLSNVKLDYVALGDSLAAGVTPNNTIDKSYPDFIQEKLKGEGVLLSYNNYGVSGYTTNDVLNSIDSANTENAGRISSISKAEIITLDIGANDLLSQIGYLISNPDKNKAMSANAIANISEIVSTLKLLNPNAKLYIMGYYNAFYYLPKEYQSYLTPILIGFNSELKALTAETEVTFIDVYEAIDKDLELYLPEVNIHPSILGYSIIADEFWDKIKIDFVKDKSLFQRFKNQLNTQIYK